MKEVKLMFYQVNPSEKNTGLKFVLWRLTSAGVEPVDDWGFAEWEGKSWGTIEVPEGYTAQVYAWANCPNPEVITLDRRIIG